MRIETTTNDRKGMVKAIAEFLGETFHYVGPPTFDYLVGNIRISRDGAVSAESLEGETELREFLEANGYVERQTDELNIVMPMDGMDSEGLKRLLFMLRSQQYLLNRAVGTPSFAVSAALVDALETATTDTMDAFLALVATNSAECRGFAFTAEAITLTFDRSEDADKNAAYTHLAAAMVARAKEATRVSPTEHKPENEKYYFRIWLLQLGMGGADCKVYRKVLMKNLRGHSAFRTDEAADKFKADMKEKRAVAKAASIATEPV